jgi:glycosyltransferase involved in cell wall biosynthesis
MNNYRIREALALALAYSGSVFGTTIDDLQNLGVVRIVWPTDGARLASPFVVNIDFYLEPWMVATSDALAGHAVCLAGGLRNGENAGLNATLNTLSQIHTGKRCVALQVDGSEMALPELNLPSSDSLAIGDAMPSQALWAWLQDPAGKVVGAPSAVAVDVYASKHWGMLAFGFEAASNSPPSYPPDDARNDNQWSDSSSTHVNTASNERSGNEDKSENEDAAAWAYARSECARSNLRVLVFSNSTSFRTGRAMAHYAEGLLAAGCDAMVGFVGDASKLMPSSEKNESIRKRESAYESSDQSKRHHPGSAGDNLGEESEEFGSTYYNGADVSAAGSASKTSQRPKPRLVVYASWSELAEAAEQGQFDVIVLEKTGNDAERHPSAAALEQLKVPSVVLAIFALWQPHGSVCAPLSSCTEGWDPSWPVLPFVSPPPPPDAARASRAAALLKDLRIPPHEFKAKTRQASSSGDTISASEEYYSVRQEDSSDINHDDASDYDAPVVLGLIKGSAHDNDIVAWTKNALLELVLHDSRVHLVLLGAGYGWLQSVFIADYVRTYHPILAESHKSAEAPSGSSDSIDKNSTDCAICRDVEKRVHWIGPVADEALKFDYLFACDLMFHVRAAGETFGNACAEFSHLGKPVLTTYNGACAHRVVLGGEGDSSSSSSSISSSRSNTHTWPVRSATEARLANKSAPNKFVDGSPAAQLWNGAQYAVVSDAKEFEAAVSAVRQRKDFLSRHEGSGGSQESDNHHFYGTSVESSLHPPSPYAVFSPARVTRRLLELISLATAVKANDTFRATTRTRHLETPFINLAILGLRQGQLIDLEPSAAASPVNVGATPDGNVEGLAMQSDEGEEDFEGSEASAAGGQLRVNAEVEMLPGSDTNGRLERFPVTSWSLCLTADLPNHWSKTVTAGSGARDSSSNRSASSDHLEVGHCARVVSEGDAPLKPLPIEALLRRALRSGPTSAALARGGKLIPVRISARVLADDVAHEGDGSTGGSDIEIAYDSVVVLAPLPQMRK